MCHPKGRLQHQIGDIYEFCFDMDRHFGKSKIKMGNCVASNKNTVYEKFQQVFV